ncbi:MAG: hypothetical protein Q8K86_00180 [Candidatus Nanopelagicaceae bacterium]|nr:hypothetical protein [Candidatus Nanopelagicaceae bacterium]
MPEKEIKKQEVPVVAAQPVVQSKSFDFDKKSVGEKKEMKDDQIFDDIIKSGGLQWEDCVLPSRGIYYGEGASSVRTPDLPNGAVKVRPMGIDVEKIMASRRFGNQAVDMMLQHCVRLPEGFDPLDLLIGDRLFLLYYIRGITYGNQYEFIMTCPNDDCHKPSTHNFDLNELARTIKLADPTIDREPFKIVLPFWSSKYGKEVYVLARFARGRDMAMMARRAALQRKAITTKPRLEIDGADEDHSMDSMDGDAIVQNLNILISEIKAGTDLRKDPFEIKQLVEKLHSSDSSTIRSYLDDKAPGMDPEISVQCPHCSTDIRTALPITEGFFRPKIRGGPGE